MTTLIGVRAPWDDVLALSHSFDEEESWKTSFPIADTFKGEVTDPQSLHKYLYTHGNPINATDPTGMSELLGTMMTIGSIGIFAALNVISFPNVANAPDPSDWTQPDASADMAGAAVIEVLLAKPFQIGFSLLAKPVEAIGNRLFSGLRKDVGNVLIGVGGEIAAMSGKVTVMLKGGLRDKAYDVFRRAAQIAGRNIDDLAKGVGSHSREGIPAFVSQEMFNGVPAMLTSLPEKLLREGLPETQLLHALHEVVHLIDIREMGYAAFKRLWDARPKEVERETEMKAWKLLTETFGENIPAATEVAHREVLEFLR